MLNSFLFIQKNLQLEEIEHFILIFIQNEFLNMGIILKIIGHILKLQVGNSA